VIRKVSVTGFGVGLGVGFGVGLGVGFAVGWGVGFAVGLGVGVFVAEGTALSWAVDADCRGEAARSPPPNGDELPWPKAVDAWLGVG